MNKEFWEGKYISNSAKWNAGSITEPLKNYIDQLSNCELKILVPGIGHGHELYYLHKQGFSDITGVDLTDMAVKQSAEVYSDFPIDKVVIKDFFSHKGQYDLILEQTFFCSLPPTMREAYVQKMYELLKPGGKVVGVLFDCEFSSEGPPFGGSKEEYTQLFQRLFDIKLLETATNSIKPRAGRELFFIISKQHD